MRGLLLLLAIFWLVAACSQEQDSETPSLESGVTEQTATPTPSLAITGTATRTDPATTEIKATFVPNTPSARQGPTPEPTATQRTEPFAPTLSADDAATVESSAPTPSVDGTVATHTPPPSVDSTITTPDTEEESQVPTPAPEAENEPVLPPAPPSPASPISLEMDISYITGTRVGAEAGFTVTLLSDGDTDNVSMSLDISSGLVLVSGDRTWTGDLQDRVPVTLGYLVHAIEIGDWGLEASAKWYFTPDSWYGDSDELCILLGENSHEAMTGQCPAQPSQATEIPELKPDP